MHDNQPHGQSGFTTGMTLDDVQVTTWGFLRTRRRKPRAADIDTNAIIMDFQVRRHVTVTDGDEVDEARWGRPLLGEERRSGSERRTP